MKKLAFIIFFLAISPLAAAEFSVAVDTPLALASGKINYIPFTFNIPEGSYIYGNPKGPGIGRETEISVQASGGLASEISVDAAEKYYAENTPDWVYRYVNGKRFYVAVTPRDTSGSITVSVDALMCSKAGFCLPVTWKQEISFSASDLNAGYPVKPGGTVRFKSATAEQKIESAVIIPYQFKPVFQSGTELGSLLAAIFFGLIAGLILNLMPCVLPVIGLKLSGFVRGAGEDRASLFRISFSFVAGIFSSFAVLASFAAFAGSGWGSPFQNVYFIRIMTFIIFALALSMFGVYSLNVPQFAAKSFPSLGKYSSSYLQGALATLLATPCSGPFLGGTLAWTLSQGRVVIFTVFASIAVGMSLPYILLPFFPNLVAKLPKSGRWSGVLERIIGFMLIGTVVYLIAISVSEIGAVVPLLSALVVLAAALWIYGEFGSYERSTLSRRIALALLLLLSVSAVALPEIFAPKKTAEISYASFSMQRLEENNKKGVISIVDFTADWCPNCFVVEKLVLSSESAQKAILDSGAELIKADITAPGTEAEALLKKIGSRSIPFLAIFTPGEKFSSPICLRDIYTKDQFAAAVRKAVERGKKGDARESIQLIEFK